MAIVPCGWLILPRPRPRPRPGAVASSAPSVPSPASTFALPPLPRFTTRPGHTPCQRVQLSARCVGCVGGVFHQRVTPLLPARLSMLCVPLCSTSIHKDIQHMSHPIFSASSAKERERATGVKVTCITHRMCLKDHLAPLSSGLPGEISAVAPSPPV